MVWNSALFLINAFCSLFSLCAHFVYSLKARSQLSSIALVNTRQLSICLCHNPWANTWFSIEMHRGYHHGFPGGHFALEATLVIDGSLGKALMISLHLPLAEQMGTQFTHLRSAQMMYRRRSGDLSHSQFLSVVSLSHWHSVDPIFYIASCFRSSWKEQPLYQTLASLLALHSHPQSAIGAPSEARL